MGCPTTQKRTQKIQLPACRSAMGLDHRAKREKRGGTGERREREIETDRGRDRQREKRQLRQSELIN